MFQKKAVEEIKSHILRSVTSFQNSCCLQNDLEECSKLDRPQVTCTVHAT